MRIKNESTATTQKDQNIEVDYQPLIDLFELLLEWNMQDVEITSNFVQIWEINRQTASRGRQNCHLALTRISLFLMIFC